MRTGHGGLYNSFLAKQEKFYIVVPVSYLISNCLRMRKGVGESRMHRAVRGYYIKGARKRNDEGREGNG